MKNLTKKAYIRKKGLECPVCRSKDGIYGEPLEMNGDNVQGFNSCDICGSDWVDHFVFKGYKHLNESKTPKQMKEIKRKAKQLI
jgi:Zn ribbon nucleic-acid-binding protein